MLAAPVTAALAAVLGVLVGVAAGRLAVVMERVAHLAEEEQAERSRYEAEQDAVLAPEDQVKWRPEQYGMTWIERWLLPLLGGVTFALFAFNEGLRWGLAIHLLWVAILLHIVGFDLKHRLILDRITFPAVICALALAPFSPGLSFGRAVVGGLAVGLFFLIQNVVSRGGIGMGDVKLGAFVGAITGLGTGMTEWGALHAVFFAVVAGGVVAFLLLITRVRHLKDPIPYGPFLCMGAAIALYQQPF